MTTTAPDDSAPLGRPPMRVAIADDHRLMLDGIKRALETAPDIKVVGEAMTGEDLVALVPRVRPDVVILDMRMPKGDGLATLQALQKSHPDLKVIMLSMFDDPEHIEKALGYGAAGYVVKSINPLDLPSTIRGVFEGNVYHPRGRRRCGRQRRRGPAGDARGPDQPRARDPQARRGRSVESGHRQQAVRHRADGEVPPFEHLPQARRRQPHRSDALRLQERPDRLAAPAWVSRRRAHAQLGWLRPADAAPAPSPAGPGAAPVQLGRA